MDTFFKIWFFVCIWIMASNLKRPLRAHDARYHAEESGGVPIATDVHIHEKSAAPLLLASGIGPRHWRRHFWEQSAKSSESLSSLRLAAAHDVNVLKSRPADLAAGFQRCLAQIYADYAFSAGHFAEHLGGLAVGTAELHDNVPRPHLRAAQVAEVFSFGGQDDGAAMHNWQQSLHAHVVGTARHGSQMHAGGYRCRVRVVRTHAVDTEHPTGKCKTCRRGT